MNALVIAAALSGALAVAAGAFGAHAAQDQAAEWLRLGGQYQLIHALAALVATRLGASGPGWAFVAGGAIFAGSLYLMALGAPRWLGAVAPVGGTLLIVGWLWLAWAGSRGVGLMRQRLLTAIGAATFLLTTAAAGKTASPPPWSVPTDNPVEQRRIVFENRGARLAGTFFIPRGTTPRAAVIALHGAQAPLHSAPLYRHLTQVMPRLGIAVLLYDRRGSGGSTSGGAAPGNFDLLADDAVAAFARLRRERGIDPARIGFWGLSQGGWLTMLAAKKEQRAAFAIAVSGPMASADVQMNFAVANILRIQGKPQAVIDRAIGARKAVDDYVRGQGTRSEAERAEAGIRAEPWYADTWIKGNIDDPEWRRQISNDPLRALRGSRVPTLIVFGQADPWVPVAASLTALRAQAKDFPQVTVRVVDGADHAMMLDVPPAQQVDARFATNAAPDAPAYFALMGAWLQATIKH